MTDVLPARQADSTEPARPATGSTEVAPAVTVSHLRKAYGSTVAVEDVSFEVNAGEIFGVLGPNGAGKTTTVECLTGLRRPDAGHVTVLGLDPRTDHARLTEVVGVQLQASRLPDRIRVDEAVELYRSFYREPADGDELLDRLGLAAARRTRYAALSGGQQQRLSVALALIGRPRLAVLDELTTGLDPVGRHEAWDLIAGIRDRGTTVVLVTHFMDEAAYLCDRVALVDRGRVVVEGTPAQLADRADNDTRLTFRPSAPLPDGLLEGLTEVSGVTRRGELVTVTGTSHSLQTVLGRLTTAGIVAEGLHVQQGTLDDAFIALTGTAEPPSPTHHDGASR